MKTAQGRPASVERVDLALRALADTWKTYLETRAKYTELFNGWNALRRMPWNESRHAECVWRESDCRTALLTYNEACKAFQSAHREYKKAMSTLIQGKQL
jgi:hypothetical protein